MCVLSIETCIHDNSSVYSSRETGVSGGVKICCLSRGIHLQQTTVFCSCCGGSVYRPAVWNVFLWTKAGKWQTRNRTKCSFFFNIFFEPCFFVHTDLSGQNSPPPVSSRQGLKTNIQQKHGVRKDRILVELERNQKQLSCSQVNSLLLHLTLVAQKQKLLGANVEKIKDQKCFSLSYLATSGSQKEEITGKQVKHFLAWESNEVQLSPPNSNRGFSPTDFFELSMKLFFKLMQTGNHFWNFVWIARDLGKGQWELCWNHETEFWVKWSISKPRVAPARMDSPWQGERSCRQFIWPDVTRWSA